MSVKNSTILGKFWLESNTDYQQRVPSSDQASVANVMATILDPMNNDIYNQFTNGLINMIGRSYVETRAFTNPYKEFKGEKLGMGKTIQRRGLDWIRAHSYEDDAETLLKVYRPDWVTSFITVNREDVYPISINRTEWAHAVDSETGLTDLVAGAMVAQVNSDEYDEMNIMLNLITEANERWGGLFTFAIPAYPDNKQNGEYFLAEMKAIANDMAFPSKKYNNMPVPCFVNTGELVLLVEARADAYIDVVTLSSVFQLDKAEIKYKKVIVPNGALPGDAFAMLTTRDFFDCHDTWFSIEPFYNPQTMTTTYYLHHQGIYAANPFAPAVLFTVGEESTTIPTLTMTPSALTLAIDKHGDTYLQTDSTYQLTANLTGTADAPVEVLPDSVLWNIAYDNAVKNSRTYIDRNGVLHIQPGIEAGDVITIKAASTYVNPDGTESAFTATITANMVGAGE